MNWYRNNWYYVGGVIFVGLAFCIGLFGAQLPVTQRLMILLYMSLLVHQYEEYAIPGGFPTSCNISLFGERELTDRYPLNSQSAFIVNIICAYPIYIFGIIFHHLPAVCIFISYFTMAQVLMHGGLMNKKLGTIYNPGVATAALLLLPLGIYTLHYLATHYALAPWHWWAPLLCFPFIAFATIMLPILKCKDRNTPYAFPARDTVGFSIKNRIARIRR